MSELKILIVEDEPVIAENIAMYLNNYDFTVSAIAYDDEEAISQLKNNTPDAVILDPPRSGCHPNLIQEIARRKIGQIVYVSCDPSTLARDIKLLSGSYSLTSARLVDMFPQTYHVETVAVLRKT